MSRQTKREAAIRYVTGDATRPQGEGPQIIAHVCNDLGRWGKGFVVAISKRWPQPREQFLAWHEGTSADRALRIYADTSDLNRVVDFMIEETELGVFDSVRASSGGGEVQ